MSTPGLSGPGRRAYLGGVEERSEGDVEMRAIQFDRFGGPDVLTLINRPDPVCGPDEALVLVQAASVNPSDVKNVEGRMHQTSLPRVPGRDYCGTVVAGPEAWLGVEVWGSGGDVGFTRDGTHAEQIVVPVASLRRKPATLSHAEAASIGVTFITAWSGLSAARLAPGETVAVIGLGGVGAAAAQIAKKLGARVIGIGRHRPAPDVPVMAALDRVIATDEQDPVAGIGTLPGHGADIVFDTVGGSMVETALKLLGQRGRLIEISAGDRRQISFDLADFYHNESQLLGVDSLKRDLTAAAMVLEALTPGFEDGSYRPPAIAETMALDRAQEAYRMVAEGMPGRVVLIPAA
jgi:NADPH:quinone reductase